MKSLDSTLLILAVTIMPVGHGLLAKERDRELALRFVPQESTGASTPTFDAAVTTRPLAISFEDARSLPDKTVVGDGTGDDDERFMWRSTNDPGAFARDVFLQTAAEWGVAIRSDADLRLDVRLVRLFVSERDQAVGSMYAAEARVELAIRNTSGRILAEGTSTGDARRYGRKRSDENCNEVLSDAVKEAYADALSDPRIQSAWSGKPLAPAVGAEAITPAELLAELVKLKREGFSTELLTDYISKKTLAVPFSTDDVSSWKEAGMEEAVIRAALARAPSTK